MADSSSAQLADTVHSAGQSFLQALQNPDSYFDLLLIAISIGVAWLAALLARLAIARHPESFAKLHISQGSARHATKLLPPLLTVFALEAIASVDVQYHHTGATLNHGFHLAMAWLLASIVLLVVQTRFVAMFLCGVIAFGATLHLLGIGHGVREYLSDTEFELGTFKLSMLGIVHGIIIFVFVFWLAGALSRALESYLRRVTSLSYNIREIIVKSFRVVAYALAGLTTLEGMGVNLTALAVFSGALGVGIGLGLQKITGSFVSGFAILFEHSIKIGDLVEIGGTTGWVRQLHMRYALVETQDGREVVIPNDELTSSRITNWTLTTPHARIEIIVPLTFDADADLARRLMLDAARAHPHCLKDPGPSCFLREFAADGMRFQLLFWIPDIREGRAGPQSEVMLAVLKAFREHELKFPTPAA